MEDIYFRLLLGHLAGDYLLQSQQMAINKNESSSQGHLWCLFHCLIYTAVVCLFLWTINPLIIALIFLSHYPIDKWSLGNRWLTLIRGRNIRDEFYDKQYSKRDISLPFAIVVYTVVDNTLHLLLMWAIIRIFII
jgi:hypothetical protein